MGVPMKPYEEVAVAFASALVSGDFEQASRLLTPTLRDKYSARALREELREMLEDYAEGPPAQIYFNADASLDDWPDKQPGDLGWAHVGIIGDDFVEGVSVVIADAGGTLFVRSIEWGRP
jgi:hypothetical protein